MHLSTIVVGTWHGRGVPALFKAKTAEPTTMSIIVVGIFGFAIMVVGGSALKLGRGMIGNLNHSQSHIAQITYYHDVENRHANW
jgi:hypothetical protein